MLCTLKVLDGHVDLITNLVFKNSLITLVNLLSITVLFYVHLANTVIFRLGCMLSKKDRCSRYCSNFKSCFETTNSINKEQLHGNQFPSTLSISFDYGGVDAMADSITIITMTIF